ncbi:ComF family protein [Gloeothece verrucosa]|uniref:Phosphoribosyltransferase n=1 Tax=Gloeothece verrucosa (strain PCC 7822) TaxID=497965 RepID=E0UIE3_GLOV7|nr:ComF family protein [Gloeothece verrucosa]ADN16911.1 phosphoribosyltransferase [Gloeothece verrucosa PCC 7822]
MFKSLLSLFFKPNCSLCERAASDSLCRDCQRQLKSCQMKNPGQFWQGDLPLFVWGEYGGKLKQAIATMKYNHHPELGTFLGRWLGEAWSKSSRSFPSKKIIVIPIPLHGDKLKERGFNQAALIASGFCQLTGYPLIAKGLERVKDTQAMFSLGTSAREENINKAFKIGKSLLKSFPHSSVLLVDDIYTTGTTVKEAAQTLRLGGIEVMGVVALSTAKKQSV